MTHLFTLYAAGSTPTLRYDITLDRAALGYRASLHLDVNHAGAAEWDVPLAAALDRLFDTQREAVIALTTVLPAIKLGPDADWSHWRDFAFARGRAYAGRVIATRSMRDDKLLFLAVPDIGPSWRTVYDEVSGSHGSSRDARPANVRAIAGEYHDGYMTAAWPAELISTP
ncbi:hypothetical protein SAMN06295974_3759 [Plantibacter flavus]|uniref:Uncharacterized protein n=1 Tax=Plantibacter flavus TaxID=150123 RepID=A0A3N2BLE0_9MICO|nr:hypothetical protein [Plantibacter flavus]ROR76093.1 hypothetical protein EDD42_4046 [Plantibacter flavus]SMG48628.1 hypothetical protein SAMN06295974_3759 [Plantibacter flavus]